MANSLPPASFRVAVADRIRQARKAKGLTLGDVANALGTSASRISEYERGLTPVNTDHIESLARAVGVTPEYLCGVSRQPPASDLTARESALLDALRRQRLGESLALVSSISEDWPARR